MLRPTDESHPFPASRATLAGAFVDPRALERGAKSIAPSAFGYGRGGTSPRLMMSYLSFERMHQCLVGHLRFAQGREFGEKLVEAGRLKNHQAARSAARRQIECVRHAWRNMHACARLGRHPFAVDMEIHDTVEDVKRLGVLAMQMQAERKFALEIVFHQRKGAAGIGGGHLDEGVIAGPVVVRSAAAAERSDSASPACTLADIKPQS